MAEQNVHQIAEWNSQSGERWDANQARLDAMLAVFGQAAIEAAAPMMGERVLDVGCGAGMSSFALAGLVGAGGRVLGVDVSAPLIERARALTPQDATAQFQVADASSAKPPEGAFDLFFSRFGVMFFDDPAGAFAHMRRALKPGGRVAFVCWRGAAENGWVRLPMASIQDRLPAAVLPHSEAPGPFSFGDQGRLHTFSRRPGSPRFPSRPWTLPSPSAKARPGTQRSTMQCDWRSKQTPWRACSPISPKTSMSALRPQFVPPLQAR